MYFRIIVLHCRDKYPDPCHGNHTGKAGPCAGFIPWRLPKNHLTFWRPSSLESCKDLLSYLRNGMITIFPFSIQNSEVQVSHLTCWAGDMVMTLRINCFVGQTSVLARKYIFEMFKCLHHRASCMSFWPGANSGILDIFNCFYPKGTGNVASVLFFANFLLN